MTIAKTQDRLQRIDKNDFNEITPPHVFDSFYCQQMQIADAMCHCRVPKKKKIQPRVCNNNNKASNPIYPSNPAAENIHPSVLPKSLVINERTPATTSPVRSCVLGKEQSGWHGEKVSEGCGIAGVF